MSDETRRSRQDQTEGASAELSAPPRRDLEEAPQLLRKASVVLICGAIIPWLTSISTMGHMPWGHWAGGVALTLLAGGVLLESAKAHAGLPANGLVKSVAGAHPMAGTGLAMLLFLAGVVVCWMGNTWFIDVKGGGTEFITTADLEALPADRIKAASDTFSLRGVMELATLLLALATFAHILAYEYGGKFNPVYPLMFLGPAVAGSLHVFTAITQPGKNPLKVLGILGSLVVGAAGIMAMYTMYVTMRQAKVEGDIKAAAMREKRKQERESRRK